MGGEGRGWDGMNESMDNLKGKGKRGKEKRGKRKRERKRMIWIMESKSADCFG